MKKIKIHILLLVALFSNAVTIQGMATKATQAARRAAQTQQLRQQTDLRERALREERLQKKYQEMEDKIQGNVNPLTERRLQKEMMKKQGQDPRRYVHSYDNSMFRVHELTMEEFKALDEDAQEKYIERLLDEEKTLPWHWEGMLDTTGPEVTLSRYDLMQIEPSNQKQKRKIIKYYFKNKQQEEEERKKIVEKLKKIEEEEQKNKESFWQRLIKSIFSSGSKE